MRVWLKLAVAEVRAEFPDWEAAQAFRIFDVTANRVWSRSDGLQAHIACLAKSCDVDQVALQTQFEMVEDTAAREMRLTRCDSKTAWPRAVHYVAATREYSRS